MGATHTGIRPGRDGTVLAAHDALGRQSIDHTKVVGDTGRSAAGGSDVPGRLTGCPGGAIGPPNPAETAYLDHLRRVLPGTGDPLAFNNDGELLAKGRYVCYMREANDLVGYEATLVSAAVTQLAFIYLCPN